MALCERCKCEIKPKKARKKKAWQWPGGKSVKSPCFDQRMGGWGRRCRVGAERDFWLKESGHGIPKELKPETEDYEDGYDFIGPLELTWESNPSFSEAAYQQHFGFPSQPGYYEVEYGKEVE